MDIIGLYIHIHLTQPRDEGKDEGLFKVSDIRHKYCIKREKIASFKLFFFNLNINPPDVHSVRLRSGLESVSTFNSIDC